MNLRCAVVLILSLSAAGVYGQEGIAGFGPLDPAPPKDMTAQQMIDKFAARESVFKKARDQYAFRQTVKVDTLEEDTNKVDGEYQQITDISFTSDGRRQEHVVFAPQNSLQRVMMSPTDFDEIEHRLPFILTTEDLPQYDVTYLGRQHVDDLDTYVFDAGPKKMEKGKHYFKGKVWVDAQDFQIVLVNGRRCRRIPGGGMKTCSHPLPRTTSRWMGSTGSRRIRRLRGICTSRHRVGR